MQIGNTEVKKKDIIPIILSIIFTIVFLWATLIANVIVNEEIYKNSWNNYFAATLSIGLLVFMEYKLRTSKRYIENFKKANQSKIKIYLSILIVIPFISKMITDKALIVVLHTIADKQYVDKTVYIKDFKKGGGYKDTCGNRIDLVGYQMYFNGKVCRVPEKALNNLNKGQKIVLHGEESYFAFTPKSFSYDE